MKLATPAGPRIRLVIDAVHDRIGVVVEGAFPPERAPAVRHAAQAFIEDRRAAILDALHAVRDRELAELKRRLVFGDETIQEPRGVLYGRPPIAPLLPLIRQAAKPTVNRRRGPR